MICRVFTGSGPTLEEATKDAESKANAELKNLPAMETVALSTNHSQTMHEPGVQPPEWHDFAITVLYQKKERR
jgi:hypothetical protein